MQTVIQIKLIARSTVNSLNAKFYNQKPEESIKHQASPLIYQIARSNGTEAIKDVDENETNRLSGLHLGQKEKVFLLLEGYLGLQQIHHLRL